MVVSGFGEYELSDSNFINVGDGLAVVNDKMICDMKKFYNCNVNVYLIDMYDGCFHDIVIELDPSAFDCYDCHNLRHANIILNTYEEKCIHKIID